MNMNPAPSLEGVLLLGMAQPGQYVPVKHLDIRQVRDELEQSSSHGVKGMLVMLRFFERGHYWVWRHGEYFVLRPVEGGEVEAVLLTKSLSPDCRGEGCDGNHDHPHQWHLVRMAMSQLTPRHRERVKAKIDPSLL